MEMPTAARRTIPADVQGKIIVQELESDIGWGIGIVEKIDRPLNERHKTVQ